MNPLGSESPRHKTRRPNSLRERYGNHDESRADRGSQARHRPEPRPKREPTLRTITIQADKPLNAIMEQWLAHLVLALPVGPDGITFDGDLANGTVVNQRTEGQWTVSFRPNPDGSRRRTYSNPYAVARVIIAREHETVANLHETVANLPVLLADDQFLLRLCSVRAQKTVKTTHD